MKKQRLDIALVENGWFETRTKAQASIMAGDVKINDVVHTKSGQLIEFNTETKVEIKSMPFVSRGGFKLEKAIIEFNLDLKNRICLDCGASTGGFTDCMLQNGAKFVYAVDVGFNQIAWKFRNHKQVKNIEKTNIKNCTKDDIYEKGVVPADFCSIDLSFISLNKVFKNIKMLLAPSNFEIIALIKPQFEAGKDQVGNGVIKEPKIHVDIIKKVLNHAILTGFIPISLTFSPIKGPKGNIEYLILFKDKGHSQIDIDETVKEAFLMLNS